MCGASGVGLEKEIETLLEFAIALGLFVFALEFLERGHQRFRNIAAAVDAEAAGDAGGLLALRGPSPLSGIFHLGASFQERSGGRHCFNWSLSLPLGSLPLWR